MFSTKSCNKNILIASDPEDSSKLNFMNAITDIFDKYISHAPLQTWFILPISLVMIVTICVLYLIVIIIKSKVWLINYSLRLGHETTEWAVCNSVQCKIAVKFQLWAKHHQWNGSGGLKIKMSSYQYRDPHVKEKTVAWPGKMIYILRRGPGNI